MKLLLLVFFLVTILTSCNGQETIPNDDVPQSDTVEAMSDNIMVVFQDSKQNYWFGSHTDGLYKYDGKTILHFTTKNGLLHNRVDEVIEDKSGNIYINTTDGINKFDGKKFTVLPVLADSLSEWELQPEDIWFKRIQETGYVYRYDGKFLHRLTLPKSPLWNEFLATHPVYTGPHDVYSIYRDSKGNMWFGTGALGVCRYNGKTFDWISEVDVTELHNGPANGVRSIVEDKEGYFWFNSAYKYNVYGTKSENKPENGFYKRVNSVGNLDGSKTSELFEYLSIAKDNKNQLWIATYDAGVYRINGKKITHYSVTNNGKEVTLFSVYKDNKGDLWLGTHQNGTYKFNGNAFERFVP